MSIYACRLYQSVLWEESLANLRTFYNISLTCSISLCSIFYACFGSVYKDKGLYPLGDIAVIGGRLSHRQPILSSILSPIPLWVWPIYWATRRLIAGQLMLPGDRKTVNLYQACLIFNYDGPRRAISHSGTEQPRMPLKTSFKK